MQNCCRRALQAGLTALLFGLCAFMCLTALWFIPGWLRQVFPSLWFIGSFPVYGFAWKHMCPPIVTVSIVSGVFMGMLCLVGWHKVVSSFKACLCIVLTAALLAAPVFGMYWHYTDILAGFVPLDASQKIFSGMLSVLGGIGLLIYGLDYVVLCILAGCLGTLWMGGRCRKTLWADLPQSAAPPALSSGRAICGGLLLYACCLGALYVVLAADVARRGAYAQAFESVFTKGTVQEITQFLDAHNPDLLKPLKPSYRYKGSQRSALVFAASNPNPDAFALVAQGVPIGDNSSIEQYLEAFDFALAGRNLSALTQIAYIFKNKKYNYVKENGVRFSESDSKMQHIVFSMVQVLRDQNKYSPADIRTILQACSDMGTFSNITRLNLSEYNMDIVALLRAEGWLSNADMDSLLSDQVQSMQCSGTVTHALLQQGANPRSTIAGHPLLPGSEHCPLLAAAAIFCTEDVITQLIAAGADPQARCENGRSITQFLDERVASLKAGGSKTKWLEQRRAIFARIVGEKPSQ